MRWLALFFLFCTSNISFSQAPLLKRICISGSDNTLFWQNPNYPCNQFRFYIIWGRNGITGSFSVIDTSFNELDINKTHLDANIGPGTPNWFYYIERRDSCGPIYNHYSDTLRVDNSNTSQSYFDSISVDPIANNVLLAWESNKTPDFDKYHLFKFDGVYTLLTPTGTKDTSYIDNTNNPSTGSITYDIYTTDSCGNPSSLGKSLHSTIYLQQSTDTCELEYTLNWSHYKGWPAIKKYYIYRKVNTGNFELIDSVTGNKNNYTSKFAIGQQSYFVRAFKDTGIVVSSSSNMVSFKIDSVKTPAFIHINYVTTNAPTSNEIHISFSALFDNYVSGYRLYILDTNKLLVNTKDLAVAQINTKINLGIDGTERYLFSMSALNWCNKVVFWGDTSTNILLVGFDSSGIRIINWNSYFTWNEAKSEYRTYRGTGENNSFLLNPWQNTNDTLLRDNSELPNIKNDGVCYYVEINPITKPLNIAKSNLKCIPGTFSLFIPNAFVPHGINNMFKPEGMLIDYSKSSMKIFNRWGQLVANKAIENGWTGKDLQDKDCPSGVYYYTFEVISLKNEKQIKSGLITLIR